MLIRHNRRSLCPCSTHALHSTPQINLRVSSNAIRPFSSTSTHLSSYRPTTRPVPPATPFVPDVPTFLSLIGRKLSQHASKISDWTALFQLSSQQLRDLGIEPARDRRYLLRWRDKFRRGEWGIGGDATFVDPEGRAEVRVVEVEKGGEIERRVREKQFGKERVKAFNEARSRANINKTAGTTRVVVNVPWSGAADAPKAAEEGSEAKEGEQEEGSSESEKPAITRFEPLDESTLQKAAPILGLKHEPARGLRGPHLRLIRGSHGEAGFLAVKEGLWEHRRGHKVDGGERRKAEVRAKRRSAENRAARA